MATSRARGRRASGSARSEPVTGITRERRPGDRRAHRRAETIACATVVNAAGAWGAEVGAFAGVDLPIRPLRRQIFVTEPRSRAGSRLPAHRRVRIVAVLPPRVRRRAAWAWRIRRTGRASTARVNWDFLPTLVERALYRLPILERANVKTGWAGLLRGHAGQAPDHRRGRRRRLPLRGRILRARDHARARGGRGDRGADRGRPHLARPHARSRTIGSAAATSSRSTTSSERAVAVPPARPRARRRRRRAPAARAHRPRAVRAVPRARRCCSSLSRSASGTRRSASRRAALKSLVPRLTVVFTRDEVRLTTLATCAG